MTAGAADVLVAVNGDRLAHPMKSFAELVRRSRHEGWYIVALDSGLDTTTGTGLKLAHFLEEAARTPIRPMELPVPPAELLFRVSGTDNEEWFHLSGHLHVEAFDRALQRGGHTIAASKRILDFGCGCGRLLPHIRLRAPQAQLFAADVDAEAVAWVREHVDGVEAAVSDPLPPLPFESGYFDLVLSFSVFSHLDEQYQDAWLAELRRVLSPGGTAIVTVNGAFSWAWHRENVLADVPELPAMERRLARREFLHWRGDGWERFFPDYYHTSWHLPGYIRHRWSPWFEVTALVEEGARPTQDIVVLRRPWGAT